MDNDIAMSKSKITLIPAVPEDYYYIAKLTEICFAYEEFGAVAFGPKRLTPAGDEKRAKRMALPANPGDTKHEMKAVATLPDGSEVVAGFASWIICRGRTGSEEEKVRLGTKEAWIQEDREKEEMKDAKTDEEGFGSAKLREHVDGAMEKILARVTEGYDYLLCTLLIVAPDFQRRGIGAMLFQDGLKVADEAGLQVILGASTQGVGLYKKCGCDEVGAVHTNLWEFEGGEGMGVNTNVVLHRPAVSGRGAKA
jgi:GNAT superfamily N-acetyltransferase